MTWGSVPITVLLYDGPLLCGFNVAIKGLKVMDEFSLNLYKDWVSIQETVD